MRILSKIINNLHRSVTTRRAMPQIWFDLMIISSIAVPFSVWTQNHNMLLIAAGLQALTVIYYFLGWVPVRKPVRRVQTITTRTRKTSARNGRAA